jgi:hypothetical protein
MNILLFGSDYDPHLKTVESRLKTKGVKAFIFDLNNKQNKISLHMNEKDTQGEFIVNDEIFSFEDIDKIWWRLKPNPYIGDNLDTHTIKDFISTEWRNLLNNLYYHIPNAIWINHPESQYKANFKTYQLSLARKVGFQIPATVFTNDANSILSKLKESNRIIYKQIGWSMFPGGEVIFTNEVTKEILTENSDSISIAPGTFQELIEKEYELRVTVVGSDVFAVKINSQDNESTLIDWRHDQLSVMYESYELSSSFKKMILEYTKLIDLKYGAFDFIKSKTYGYIFLECNPSGQWLWIEDKVESYKITESLVNLFVK